MRIALIMLFGAIGTLARYGLQGIVQVRAAGTFPTGTLAVNLSGCFFLGILAQYMFNHLVVTSDWRAAISIGFFGSFTTFSSFSWETMKMAEDGEWLKAAIYVFTSVVFGLLLTFLGIRIASRF